MSILRNILLGAALVSYPVTGRVTLAQQTCGENEYQYNEFTCFNLSSSSQPRTYPEAAQACQEMGMELASIHSWGEHEYIVDKLEAESQNTGAADFGVWIGLSDRLAKGKFKWEDGSPLDYLSWGPDEPNDENNDYDVGEDCVELSRAPDNNFMMNASPCNRNKRFLCRRSPSQKSLQLQVCKSGKRYSWSDTCFAHFDTTNPRNYYASNQFCETRDMQLASRPNVWETEWLNTTIDQYTFERIWIVKGNEGCCSTGITGDDACVPDAKTCGKFVLCSASTSYIRISTGSCSEGSHNFKSSCYWISNEEKTYSEAEKACKEKFMEIASLHSQPEMEFVIGKMKESELAKAWIGLTDKTTEGSFVWADGSALRPASELNWGQNEPDNYGGNESCTVLSTGPHSSFFWFDLNCAKYKSFVCKGPSLRVQTPIAYTCEDDEIPWEKDYCFWRSGESANFTGAQKACSDRGMNLAYIRDKDTAQLDFVASFIPSGEWTISSSASGECNLISAPGEGSSCNLVSASGEGSGLYVTQSYNCKLRVLKFLCKGLKKYRNP